ncbi:MAG: STAS domain-containing protein [Phycisphaerales bacterium]|nr:STAS domain-containing protein [Phycisphaerales bacterium]
MAASFEVVSADSTCTHVRIRGSLDVTGTGSISLKFTASTAARRQHVLLDMSEVDFVASIGLGLLMQVARALASDGKRVIVVSPSAAVAGVIRTTKVDAVMPVAASLDEARTMIG